MNKDENKDQLLIDEPISDGKSKISGYKEQLKNDIKSGNHRKRRFAKKQLMKLNKIPFTNNEGIVENWTDEYEECLRDKYNTKKYLEKINKNNIEGRKKHEEYVKKQKKQINEYEKKRLLKRKKFLIELFGEEKGKEKLQEELINDAKKKRKKLEKKQLKKNK